MRIAPDQIDFSGPIVIIGFGSIGKGALPLILRHIRAPRSKMVVISPDDSCRRLAELEGVRFEKVALGPNNYRSVLAPLITGGFVVNLSVEVSSVALIGLCREHDALYIDTCIEPWAGGYTDTSLSAGKRTNYALRDAALALRAGQERAPTAVLTHGANPGLVSHFVKQALLNIAAEGGIAVNEPTNRAGWAALARQLGVRVVHIAERDSQVSNVPKRPNQFLNTWSVDGFVSEGQQPAELGWGSHERNFPRDGHRHDFGNGAAIYLSQPGAATRVRTWTPLAGPIHGFLITHSEAVSISDYYTVSENGKVVYRPTAHYAYHPSDAAVLSLHEFAGRNWNLQAEKHILMDEIVSGVDELGVLLAGHHGNAYWYGSQLSIDEARKLAPYNNATSLQVTVSVLSGMIWAMENPNRGVVEPDEMDWRRNLQICTPYLGTVTGAYTQWTPLTDRERLFSEDVDRSDPWQFKNVRV